MLLTRGQTSWLHRFDPLDLYTFVITPGTVGMFLAKFLAQEGFSEKADVSSAHMYGDINVPIIM